MADAAGLFAQLLPDPDPGRELRKLIDEILATAKRMLSIAGEVPPDQASRSSNTIAVINPHNAGRIVVAAAIEELESALADLLLARQHEDYLRATCRLLRSARALAPYDIGAIPGTARAVLGREQARELARSAGRAKQEQNKQRPPTARERAFDEVVAGLLAKGTALTVANLKKVLDKMTGEDMPMPRSALDRLFQKYRQRVAFNAAVDGLLQRGAKVSTQNLIPALGKMMPHSVIERLVQKYR